MLEEEIDKVCLDDLIMYCATCQYCTLLLGIGCAYHLHSQIGLTNIFKARMLVSKERKPFKNGRLSPTEDNVDI